MENELQKMNPTGLSTKNLAVSQQAQKIVNVEKADKVTTGDIMNYTYIVAGNQIDELPSGDCGTNREYYNLFVMGEQEFSAMGYFYVQKERALNTPATSDSIREQINDLNPSAIEQILTFPAIFCAENHQMGKTDDMQMAFYGIVTKIKVQDNGIKVYYRVFNQFRQQILNDNLFEFGLAGNNKFNELNRTQWSVKRIDLIETLRENGVRVLSY